MGIAVDFSKRKRKARFWRPPVLASYMSRVRRSPSGIVDRHPEYARSIKLNGVGGGALMWIFGPCSINESVTTETRQQRRSEGGRQRPDVHPSFINHHCIHSQWSQSRRAAPSCTSDTSVRASLADQTQRSTHFLSWISCM